VGNDRNLVVLFILMLTASSLALSGHAPAPPTVGSPQGEVRAHPQMEPEATPTATLRMIAYPWNTNLDDSELTFALGPGAEQSVFNGSTLSLVASRYPLQVNVSLFAGEVYATVQVTQTGSHVSLEVNASMVSVSTLIGGVETAGASITVSMNGGGEIAAATGGTEPTVFFLPLGNYTVTATLRNTTQTDDILSQTGKSSSIVFDLLGQSGSPTPYNSTYYLLLATGLIGAAISAGVWIKVYRNRHGRVPETQP
jgi:hypothetical protein